jgi:probable phosphoglycerate mutase
VTDRLRATPPTHLFLVRHGETVWHADNRYAGGGSDIDLTERGHGQAVALARWAGTEAFDALVVSPVRRAQETAAPSANALGLEPIVVDDLREVDFGIAEGRTIGELRDLDSDMVHRFQSDPERHPFPGSEAPETAAARAASTLRDLAATYAGGRILVVAHNTLLRLALCDLLGIPVARYRSLFPKLRNAAITEVSVPYDDAPASLLSLNTTPWATDAQNPQGATE